jgi:hypothetical protein
MRYITMANLTLTEGLGSQMYHVAVLESISQNTGHSICFFEENNSLGKGLLLNKTMFPNLPVLTPSISQLSNEDLTVVVYPIRKDVIVDTNLYSLDPRYNYNFSGLFHSYKMWMPILDHIKHIYTPAEIIYCEAKKIIDSFKRDQRKLVSIHVRRGDYLLPINSFFAQLSIDYYLSAISKFNGMDCDFLVFSDDISWCKENFANTKNLTFAEGSSSIVDLFAMSICDHNIISNSSFGMWSAVLNKNPGRKVICPGKYCRNDLSVPFFNYNWFPDDFTPLFNGNC